jgi:putative aldouronate transport system permease protein
MMFSGGLAPTVMVCRNLLGLSDNYAALIVPIMVNPFLFIVMRTFFKTSIPMSLVESASIDGSGEFNTLFRIVMPIAKPGIATVGLLFALAYWNEWFLALVFIRNRNLYPLQYLLMLMQLSVENLKNSIQMVGMSSVNLMEMPTEGLRMAVCVFIVLPIACAYPFFQRYIIAGLTVGAVKE